MYLFFFLFYKQYIVIIGNQEIHVLNTRRLKLPISLLIGGSLTLLTFWNIPFSTLYLYLCVGIVLLQYFPKEISVFFFYCISLQKVLFQVKKEPKSVFNMKCYKRTNYLFFSISNFSKFYCVFKLVISTHHTKPKLWSVL